MSCQFIRPPVILISLILLLSPYSRAQEHSLERTTDTSKLLSTGNHPQKRSDCGFVELNGKFYLIGGRGIKPVEVFDPKTKTWQQKAPTPFEMHHFQAITYKEEIYVVGGMTGNYPHEKPLEHVYIYNPRKDSWRQGPVIPPERRRGSGGTIVYKKKIYFIGGIQDGHYEGTVPWFDVLHPRTGRFTTLIQAPHARDHFHAVVIRHQLYIAGGRRTSAKTGEVIELTTPEIDVYNFKKKQWKTLPKEQNLPIPRAGCTALNFKNQLLIIGGESVAHLEAHKEVHTYKPKKGFWKTFGTLSIGRHDTQALVYNNSMYIACGASERGGGPNLDTIEIINE